jgi:hypothetical protein
MDNTDEHDETQRPLALNLMAGLYLFFFLISASTFGNPFPFFGQILEGNSAKIVVFADSIICLYLFLGIMKRQILAWYSLLGYNLIEIINTVANLKFIPLKELEKYLGSHVQQETLLTNNIAAALAILLLSQFIYRHKHYFTSRDKYIF